MTLYWYDSLAQVEKVHLGKKGEPKGARLALQGSRQEKKQGKMHESDLILKEINSI